MRLKTFLAILFAAGMIVLGALLPEFAARQQDAANDNQVLFASIQNVQLEFSQGEMTVSQAVALLGKNTDVVEIPESLANLKWEKVKTIFLEALERYQEEGLFFQDMTEDFTIGHDTLLYYGNGSYDSGTQWNNIYWRLYCNRADGTAAVYMTIDDRTGTICSVEYADSENTYQQADRQAILSGFCTRYLADLGEEFYWCEVTDIVKKAVASSDGYYLASSISWADGDYGECNILFFLHESGFYTLIS